MNNRTPDSHYPWTKKWGAGQLATSMTTLYPSFLVAMIDLQAATQAWAQLFASIPRNMDSSYLIASATLIRGLVYLSTSQA